MSNYGELLKDPRWQKKRLEIMERDDFACQCCGERYKTLNVHHMWYEKLPWDTPNMMLITLCEECHKGEENAKDPFKLDRAFKALSSRVPRLMLLDFLESAVALVDHGHPTNYPVRRFKAHLKSFK